VPLLRCVGPAWECHAGEIRVQQGYRWDGASGPAINDDAAIMGSLVHDIVCTRINLPGARHPLPGYMARHCLYARILRAQGAPRTRAVYSWLALMACNWMLDLGRDGLET
jgi:hypothetical protein